MLSNGVSFLDPFHATNPPSPSKLPRDTFREYIKRPMTWNWSAFNKLSQYFHDRGPYHTETKIKTSFYIIGTFAMKESMICASLRQWCHQFTTIIVFNLSRINVNFEQVQLVFFSLNFEHELAQVCYWKFCKIFSK